MLVLFQRNKGSRWLKGESISLWAAFERLGITDDVKETSDVIAHLRSEGEFIGGGPPPEPFWRISRVAVNSHT